VNDRARGRGRVGFHVPYLYPLMSGAAGGYTGGMEVQQRLLARGLGARGFHPWVVTCDYGQAPLVTLEGVTLVRSFPPHAGLPVVRFLHPRLTRTVAALWTMDADVYFMQGSGLLAGVTCDVAHARGRPFVFLAAHDFDTLRAMPDQARGRERWWYRRALTGCDLRLVQTEWQRGSLEREWHLSATVVRNPVERPAQVADAGRAGAVLWLATYKASKRPEWFTALAAALPEHRFVMAGVIPEPPLTREPYEAALAASRAHPQLQVGGYVDHDRVGALYGDASLLVHTSAAEGFSNVFLEAWAHGIPTVTAVDPDGVIAAHGLGVVVNDRDALIEAVRALLADPDRRRAMGAAARAYVERHHDPGTIYDRLAGMLDPLVRTGRRGGRVTHAAITPHAVTASDRTRNSERGWS
jgi:glycosyltransferase involved in cell wall biosynthesis